MRSKVNRLGAFLLISGMLVSLLAACTPLAEETTPSVISITDQLERAVKLDRIPQRIISIAPSNTEILFALGLADRVVGVTDYDDYPPAVKEKPSVGGYTMPNIEKIVEIQPDLILATSVHEQRIIPQLEERGLTVFALAPKTLDDVLAAITLVGEITGQEKEASRLVAEMQGRIKAVIDRTANLPQGQRPRVFYITWHDPLMAPGSGTFQDDLIGKAGGINISRDLIGYANISLEAIIVANPEVMIAGVGHGNMANLTSRFIETEPRLRDTEARQSNRIYEVDGNLVSRPGPRIVEGLEALARLIHPEVFGLKK